MAQPDPHAAGTPAHDPANILAHAMRAALRHERFEDAARAIFDLAKELIGATAGYVALLSDEGAENEVLFLDAGGKECTVDPSLPMPIRGLREQAYRILRPVYENDFWHSQWVEFMPAGHAALDNVLFAPLVIDGSAVGLIGLANKPGGFDDMDLEHAAMFGEAGAVALSTARIMERLHTNESRLQSQLVFNSQQLAETSRVMAAILEHTHIMAVLLDREFNFIWANRAYAETCGQHPDFFPGKNHFELYPNPENQAIFSRVIETGEPFFVESRPFSYPDQPERGVTYWDWSLIPIVGSEGEVTSLVFTLVDATERTRTELAGSLIERLHQSAAGRSPSEMLTETLDGLCELLESPVGFYHFLEPNERTLSLQAWSTATREHFCRAEGAGLHYDVDQAGVWADCLRERRPIVHNDYATLENKRGMPEGHAEVVRELVVPIFREQRIVGILGVGNSARAYHDADVALVSHVAGAAWEVAERIRTNEELARSEDRYRRSLELVPEAIFMNRSGRFVYVNEACMRLFGAENAHSLLGMKVMDRIAPGRRDIAGARIGALLECGGVAPLDETTMLRMDGSPIDVEVTATAFEMPEGPTIEVVVRDITERKLAAEALEQAERFSRGVLDSIPARIAVLDEQGVVVALNEVWARFARENPTSTQAISPGADYLAVCGSADEMACDETSGFADGIRSVIDGRQANVRQEVRCETGDGPRWFIAVASRFVGSGPLRVVVSFRDITDLKSAQEELATNAENLAEAQAVARLGWFVVDTGSGMWESSDVLDSILGIDALYCMDVAGWLSIIHPGDRETMRTLTLKALEANTPLDAQCRIVRVSDGEVRWVHVRGQLDSDAQAGVMRIMGTLQDVTEQQLAELAIRESEERYRALIEHSPLAIFVNRADRVNLANRACAELFRAASPEVLIGMSVFDLFHPDDREVVGQRIERLRTSGKPRPLAIERIARLDGEYRHAEVSAAPFLQGGETLIHVVLRDITEEREAEQELQQYQQKLGDLASELIRTSERERHRLAIELHDGIGQALAAAKISAQTMASNCPGAGAEPESARLLGLIDYSIHHVRSMTAQLSPPALYELGLVPALERLIDDLRGLYGIECVFDVEYAPVELKDTIGPILFRAARELLSNVHRHADTNLARLTLEERFKTIILRVEDDGRGFDTTTVDNRSVTDCFGLFSLREEVRHAGGTVILRSSPGHGTSVEVSVPEDAEV